MLVMLDDGTIWLFGGLFGDTILFASVSVDIIRLVGTSDDINNEISVSLKLITAQLSSTTIKFRCWQS